MWVTTITALMPVVSTFAKRTGIGMRSAASSVLARGRSKATPTPLEATESSGSRAAGDAMWSTRVETHAPDHVSRVAYTRADWEPDVDDIGADDIGGNVGADDIGGNVGADDIGGDLDELPTETLDTPRLVTRPVAPIEVPPGFGGHFDEMVYDDLERRAEWTFKPSQRRPLSAASTETVSQEDDVIVHDLESMAGSEALKPDE